MRRTLLSTVLLASVAVVAVGCSDARPNQAVAGRSTESRAFRGSVVFAVGTKGDPGEVTTDSCRTSLTVAKSGRTPLVDKDPDAGGSGVYGWHNFPSGTTGAGAAAYYAGWLTNNGWRQPEDFTVNDNVIVFFGVSDLKATCNNAQMVVSRTVDEE